MSLSLPELNPAQDQKIFLFPNLNLNEHWLLSPKIYYLLTQSDPFWGSGVLQSSEAKRGFQSQDHSGGSQGWVILQWE